MTFSHEIAARTLWAEARGEPVDGQRAVAVRVYLYAIRFPNGKQYIGITNSLRSRLKQHKSRARRGINTPLYAAIRKHGANNITMTPLVVGDTAYIADLEVAAIARFQTRDRRYGYNVSLGGELSPMASEETRLKMRATIRTPEVRAARRAAVLGIKRSDETKKNISDAKKLRRGWHHSEETRTKIAKSNTGKKHTEETKLNLSAALKGRARCRYTDKTRQARSDWSKSLWASPWGEANRAKLIARNKAKSNKGEG